MPNTTTDSIATLSLAAYERPVSLLVLRAGQDWAQRQKLQYAALKGLLMEDFLGLKDWQEQIGLYSKTNLQILMPAEKAIKVLEPLNRNIREDVIPDPLLGMSVGSRLVETAGLDVAFAFPTSILEDSAQLNQVLSS